MGSIKDAGEYGDCSGSLSDAQVPCSTWLLDTCLSSCRGSCPSLDQVTVRELLFSDSEDDRSVFSFKTCSSGKESGGAGGVWCSCGEVCLTDADTDASSECSLGRFAPSSEDLWQWNPSYEEDDHSVPSTDTRGASSVAMQALRGQQTAPCQVLLPREVPGHSASMEPHRQLLFASPVGDRPARSRLGCSENISITPDSFPDSHSSQQPWQPSVCRGSCANGDVECVLITSHDARCTIDLEGDCAHCEHRRTPSPATHTSTLPHTPTCEHQQAPGLRGVSVTDKKTEEGAFVTVGEKDGSAPPQAAPPVPRERCHHQQVQRPPPDAVRRPTHSYLGTHPLGPALTACRSPPRHDGLDHSLMADIFSDSSPRIPGQKRITVIHVNEADRGTRVDDSNPSEEPGSQLSGAQGSRAQTLSGVYSHVEDEPDEDMGAQGLVIIEQSDAVECGQNDVSEAGDSDGGGSHGDVMDAGLRSKTTHRRPFLDTGVSPRYQTFPSESGDGVGGVRKCSRNSSSSRNSSIPGGCVPATTTLTPVADSGTHPSAASHLLLPQQLPQLPPQASGAYPTHAVMGRSGTVPYRPVLSSFGAKLGSPSALPLWSDCECLGKDTTLTHGKGNEHCLADNDGVLKRMEGASEGDGVRSEGVAVHSEGDNLRSEGDDAHSEGDDAHSEGDDVHSEGDDVSSEDDDIYNEDDDVHTEGDDVYNEGDNNNKCSEGAVTRQIDGSRVPASSLPGGTGPSLCPPPPTSSATGASSDGHSEVTGACLKEPTWRHSGQACCHNSELDHRHGGPDCSPGGLWLPESTPEGRGSGQRESESGEGGSGGEGESGQWENSGLVHARPVLVLDDCPYDHFTHPLLSLPSLSHPSPAPPSPALPSPPHPSPPHTHAALYKHSPSLGEDECVCSENTALSQDWCDLAWWQDESECQVPQQAGTGGRSAGSCGHGTVGEAHLAWCPGEVIGSLQVLVRDVLWCFPVYGTGDQCQHALSDVWELVLAGHGWHTAINSVGELVTMSSDNNMEGPAPSASLRSEPPPIPTTHSSIYGFKIANNEQAKVRNLVPLFAGNKSASTRDICSNVTFRVKGDATWQTHRPNRNSDMCDVQMYRGADTRSSTPGPSEEGEAVIKLCGVNLGSRPSSPDPYPLFRCHTLPRKLPQFRLSPLPPWPQETPEIQVASPEAESVGLSSEPTSPRLPEVQRAGVQHEPDTALRSILASNNTPVDVFYGEVEGGGGSVGVEQVGGDGHEPHTTPPWTSTPLHQWSSTPYTLTAPKKPTSECTSHSSGPTRPVLPWGSPVTLAPPRGGCVNAIPRPYTAGRSYPGGHHPVSHPNVCQDIKSDALEGRVASVQLELDTTPPLPSPGDELRAPQQGRGELGGAGDFQLTTCTDNFRPSSPCVGGVGYNSGVSGRQNINKASCLPATGGHNIPGAVSTRVEDAGPLSKPSHVNGHTLQTSETWLSTFPPTPPTGSSHGAATETNIADCYGKPGPLAPERVGPGAHDVPKVNTAALETSNDLLPWLKIIEPLPAYMAAAPQVNIPPPLYNTSQVKTVSSVNTMPHSIENRTIIKQSGMKRPLFPTGVKPSCPAEQVGTRAGPCHDQVEPQQTMAAATEHLVPPESKHSEANIGLAEYSCIPKVPSHATRDTKLTYFVQKDPSQADTEKEHLCVSQHGPPQSPPEPPLRNQSKTTRRMTAVVKSDKTEAEPTHNKIEPQQTVTTGPVKYSHGQEWSSQGIIDCAKPWLTQEEFSQTVVGPTELCLDQEQFSQTVIGPTEPCLDQEQFSQTVIGPTEPCLDQDEFSQTVIGPTELCLDQEQFSQTVIGPTEPCLDQEQFSQTVIGPTEPYLDQDEFSQTVIGPTEPCLDQEQFSQTVVGPTEPCLDQEQFSQTVVGPTEPYLDQEQFSQTVVGPTEPYLDQEQFSQTVIGPTEPCLDQDEFSQTVVGPTEPCLDQEQFSQIFVGLTEPCLDQEEFSQTVVGPTEPCLDQEQFSQTVVGPTEPCLDQEQFSQTVVGPTELCLDQEQFSQTVVGPTEPCLDQEQFSQTVDGPTEPCLDQEEFSQTVAGPEAHSKSEERYSLSSSVPGKACNSQMEFSKTVTDLVEPCRYQHEPLETEDGTTGPCNRQNVFSQSISGPTEPYHSQDEFSKPTSEPVERCYSQEVPSLSVNCSEEPSHSQEVLSESVIGQTEARCKQEAPPQLMPGTVNCCQGQSRRDVGAGGIITPEEHIDIGAVSDSKLRCVSSKREVSAVKDFNLGRPRTSTVTSSGAHTPLTDDIMYPDAILKVDSKLLHIKKLFTPCLDGKVSEYEEYKNIDLDKQDLSRDEGGTLVSGQQDSSSIAGGTKVPEDLAASPGSRSLSSSVVIEREECCNEEDGLNVLKSDAGAVVEIDSEVQESATGRASMRDTAAREGSLSVDTSTCSVGRGKGAYDPLIVRHQQDGGQTKRRSMRFPLDIICGTKLQHQQKAGELSQPEFTRHRLSSLGHVQPLSASPGHADTGARSKSASRIGSGLPDHGAPNIQKLGPGGGCTSEQLDTSRVENIRVLPPSPSPPLLPLDPILENKIKLTIGFCAGNLLSNNSKCPAVSSDTVTPESGHNMNVIHNGVTLETSCTTASPQYSKDIPESVSSLLTGNAPDAVRSSVDHVPAHSKEQPLKDAVMQTDGLNSVLEDVFGGIEGFGENIHRNLDTSFIPTSIPPLASFVNEDDEKSLHCCADGVDAHQLVITADGGMIHSNGRGVKTAALTTIQGEESPVLHKVQRMDNQPQDFEQLSPHHHQHGVKYQGQTQGRQEQEHYMHEQVQCNQKQKQEQERGKQEQGKQQQECGEQEQEHSKHEQEHSSHEQAHGNQDHEEEQETQEEHELLWYKSSGESSEHRPPLLGVPPSVLLPGVKLNQTILNQPAQVVSLDDPHKIDSSPGTSTLANYKTNLLYIDELESDTGLTRQGTEGDMDMATLLGIEQRASGWEGAPCTHRAVACCSGNQQVDTSLGPSQPHSPTIPSNIMVDNDGLRQPSVVKTTDTVSRNNDSVSSADGMVQQKVCVEVIEEMPSSPVMLCIGGISALIREESVDEYEQALEVVTPDPGHGFSHSSASVATVVRVDTPAGYSHPPPAEEEGEDEFVDASDTLDLGKEAINTLARVIDPEHHQIHIPSTSVHAQKVVTNEAISVSTSDILSSEDMLGNRSENITCTLSSSASGEVSGVVYQNTRHLPVITKRMGNTMPEDGSVSSGHITDPGMLASASASSTGSENSWTSGGGPVTRRDLLPLDEDEEEAHWRALLAVKMSQSEEDPAGYESDEDFDTVDADMRRLEEKLKKFERELGEDNEEDINTMVQEQDGCNNNTSVLQSQDSESLRFFPLPHVFPTVPSAKTKHLSLMTRLEVQEYEDSASESESDSEAISSSDSADFLFVKTKIKLKPGDRKCRSLDPKRSKDLYILNKSREDRRRASKVHDNSCICEEQLDLSNLNLPVATMDGDAVHSRVPNSQHHSGNEPAVGDSTIAGQDEYRASKHLDSLPPISAEHLEASQEEVSGALLHGGDQLLLGYIWHEQDGMSVVDFEGLEDFQSLEGHGALMIMFEDDDDLVIDEASDSDMLCEPTDVIPGYQSCKESMGEGSECESEPRSPRDSDSSTVPVTPHRSRKGSEKTFVAAFKSSLRRASKYLGPKSENHPRKASQNSGHDLSHSGRSCSMGLDEESSAGVYNVQSGRVAAVVTQCPTSDSDGPDTCCSSGEYYATPALCVNTSDEDPPTVHAPTSSQCDHFQPQNLFRDTSIFTTDTAGQPPVPPPRWVQRKLHALQDVPRRPPPSVHDTRYTHPATSVWTQPSTSHTMAQAPPTAQPYSPIQLPPNGKEMQFYLVGIPNSNPREGKTCLPVMTQGESELAEEGASVQEMPPPLPAPPLYGNNIVPDGGWLPSNYPHHTNNNHSCTVPNHRFIGVDVDLSLDSPLHASEDSSTIPSHKPTSVKQLKRKQQEKVLRQEAEETVGCTFCMGTPLMRARPPEDSSHWRQPSPHPRGINDRRSWPLRK
ncbi:uncharacterized protein [Procambarus clarkii]|uniref:uncharacterized protein n=1 Tax=Procambarus clarkii TaxID=6728 RepID=UPI003742EA4C